MRVTERGVLLTSTMLLAAVSVVAVMASGGIAFDVGGWTLLLWGPGFGLCGAMVTRRYPRHAVGRLLQWAGASAASISLLNVLGESLPPGLVEGVVGQVVGAMVGVVWIAPFVLVFAAIARFPDGSWANRWSARFLWLFLVAFGAQVPLGFMGFEEDALAVQFTNVVSAIAVFGLVVSVVASLVRSMRGDPVRRRQTGWVLFGLLVSGALWIGLGAVVGAPVWIGPVSFLIFPVTLVIAITRYKLYEIDRIVSRTLAYAVVIGVLVAVYFGLVVVLRSLVPVEGPLPVALSTLAVAFAFFPLARRVQGWVDRRFFRSRYDAAAVVSSFADELRGTIDTSAVIDRTEHVLDDVFAPEHLGVWVAES